MLVIFDLDDTLIETSKYVTPRRLEEALKRMVAHGLEIESFEKAFQLLLEINHTAASSYQAVEIFAGLYPGGLKGLTYALQTFKDPLPQSMEIQAAEGAIELLGELANSHHILALVTKGDYEIQLEKMKKAGIQPEFFSKIIAGTGMSKRPYYETVLQELRPSLGLVCGDRISLDLTPAKELGLRTVHILAGRGTQQLQPACDVDFTIEKLDELREIIKAVEA